MTAPHTWLTSPRMGSGNNISSQTALVEAIRRQDEGALQRLLQVGDIDLNRYDPENHSYPIEDCAAWLDGLVVLLDAGADVHCSGLIPPLLVAAMAQRTDCIDLLLKHGANVDSFGVIGGRTALMEVASMQHPCRDPDGAAARLLAGGADPDLVNFAGDTALDIARFAAENREHLVKSGGLYQPHEFQTVMLPVHRCVELLTAATSHITKEVNFWRLCPERYRADAFVELAINQRLDWLRQFLGHGHPVDAPDRLGSTAIQASCRFNYLDSVSCLLAAGADPHQCQNGQALEDLLYDNDDGAAIRALLAEYRRRDITGESPQA